MFSCSIVLLSLFTIASCDIIYIVTSPSDPCPGEFTGVPCLTLDQYALNPSRSENITFLIEPGTYTLSTALRVSNAYNFTMSSSNATVLCTTSAATISLNTIQNVHINGMGFNGCRSSAIVLQSVSNATISSTSFVNNQGGGENGGAVVYINSSKVIFYRAMFMHNSGRAIYGLYSTMVVEGSTFSHNGLEYSFDGGAIYCSGTLKVIGTTFENNNGNAGGAISYYHSNYYQFGERIAANLSITESRFVNNRAGYNGGAINIQIYHNTDKNIAITRCYFGGNTGSSVGGAIYLSARYTTFLVTGCNFTGNSATGSWISTSSGGAIYVSQSYTVVTECQFTNNSATCRYDCSSGYNGGAIYQSGNYTVMTGCDFKDNVATGSGGAIYKTGSSINMIRCRFHNNAANKNGGAFYKTGKNDTVVLFNTDIKNSRAGVYGGAIFVSGTNNFISVTGGFFRGNTAEQQSGGVIYINSRYANVNISSSTFTNNSAAYCGVLDVDNFDHFRVDLTNSVFTYNTATGQTIGGGVACIRNASINVINSSFKHNSANYHAGVFYIDESVTTVDGSLFINNSAALNGGVFYTYVHASEYIIRGSQFSKNSAGDDGGVISIGRLNSHISIDETIFDFNSAEDRGGVIALVGSSMFMEINGSNIYNNTAQFGGVISACNSHVTIRGDILNVTVDPVHPICKLYDGDVRRYNITTPQDPEVAMTTTAPLTAVPPTTDLTLNTRSMSSTDTPSTTSEWTIEHRPTTNDIVTQSGTQRTVGPTTTTNEINHSATSLDEATETIKPDDGTHSEGPPNWNTSFILSVTSLCVCLILAIIVALLILTLVIVCLNKKRTKKSDHKEEVSTQLSKYSALKNEEDQEL